MINDLDSTLEELVRNELRRLREEQPNLPGELGEITFAFKQPKSGWNSTGESGLALNFFLYDVRENPVLRRHHVETTPNGANGDGRFVQQKRLPLRLDCFYLVTAWAAEPRWEHWLLTSCLKILARYAVLPEDQLQGDLKTQPFEIRTKVAAHDVLTNPAEVWSALGNDLHASFSYVVTLALDPWQPITVPVVTTVVTRVGQLQTPKAGESAQPLPPITRAEDMLEEL